MTITSKFVRTGNSGTPEWGEQWIYSSNPPIRPKPLPYGRWYGVCRGGGQSYNVNGLSLVTRMRPLVSSSPGSWDATQRNKLHEKLWSKIHETAEMATAIATHKEAVDMIVNRATRIYKAYKALRKGKFKRFLHELAVPPKPKHLKTKWSRPKDASALWLEYHFGWSPAIGDIYAAIDILQADYPNKIVRAAVKRSWQYVYRSPTGATNNFNEERTLYRETMAAQVVVEVENYNLYRANQLGLVNPANVVWETIPFSFMVDWFIPVGDFLNSFTEELGLSLTDKRMTLLWEAEGTLWRKYSSLNAVIPLRGYMVRRVTGVLPGVQLTMSLPHLGVKRGATSIALLVGLFTKG